MASPEALVSALADPDRLQLFARICTAPEGLPVPEDRRTAKQANRLLSAGLIARDEDRYRAVPEVFRDALAKPATDPVDALFSHGRLVAIPKPGEARRALLTKVATRFDAERVYREQDIRENLAQIYDDHVALRRFLVDEGLLHRETDGSLYWRTA